MTAKVPAVITNTCVIDPIEYIRKTEPNDIPIVAENARNKIVRVVALYFCRPAFIAMINAKGARIITQLISPPDPTS
jgi:hypothetical protein